MIIAAFDLATLTGCCDGEAASRKPRLWSWHLTDGGDDRPHKLYQLRCFLMRYFKQEPCDGVVYENPMPIGFLTNKKDGRVMMSEANVALARGLVGVLEATCAEFDKAIEGLSVQDARQSVLGWRTNRSDIATKQRVMLDARKLGGDPENDNEADAFVLWSYACARANPKHALQMTPLFGGQMQ